MKTLTCYKLDIKTKLFTLNKYYEVIEEINNLMTIIDDLGHRRSIVIVDGKGKFVLDSDYSRVYVAAFSLDSTH